MRTPAEAKLVRKAPGSTIRTEMLNGASSPESDSDSPIKESERDEMGERVSRCTFERELGRRVEAAGGASG